MKAVHLHIDRIAVEGLAESEQRKFARTLEEHLHAWAASDAASGIASGVKISALDAGMIKPGATARQAATQVVNSLARRLGERANGNVRRPAQTPANADGKEARGHA